MPNSIIRRCQVQEDSTCLQVLLKSTFNVAGQGSNLFAGASFFPEASLVLTKNAFDCRGNALQGQTLEELVADTRLQPILKAVYSTQYCSDFRNKHITAHSGT